MFQNHSLIIRLRKIVESNLFQNFILGVILVNSFFIGVETFYRPLWIHILQTTCLYIFVVEILMKYIAKRSNHEFFTNGWNIFDIIIIGSAFIPPASSVSTILRILRVFRVFRMVRAIPELKLMVSVLVRSITSLGYVGLLLGIFFYIYAIIGVEIFGEHFKEYATLKEAFYTLFRSLTLEDWTDLRYMQIQKFGYWLPTLYHVSWVILSALLMANLVVGAIINNYQVVLDEKNDDPDENSTKEPRQPGLYALSDDRIRELVDELNHIIKSRREQNGLS